MEQTFNFTMDFAYIMFMAGLSLLFFYRLKQPSILGYIVIGFLLGPKMFDIVVSFLASISESSSEFLHGLVYHSSSMNIIEKISDLAVILLLFTLGLEFNIRKLKSVGVSAVVAAITEIAIMFITGCVIGKFFGWNMLQCLFLGAILGTSSTMVISKTLAEKKLFKERFSGIIIGITVVEDIICISLMAVLASVALTGTIEMKDIAKTFGKLFLFLILVGFSGFLIVPRLMNYVVKQENSELLLLTSLCICFGLAYHAEWLGYSTALGAFIAGALIAETSAIHKVEKVIQPIKEMFTALFFVSVGAMIDPSALIKFWSEIVILVLVVIIAKTFACALGALSTGNDFRSSMKVGLGMSNVGEVSFIILAMGMSLEAIDSNIYMIGASVAIVTMLLTPFTFNGSDFIIRICTKLMPKVLMQAIGVYMNWYQHKDLVKVDEVDKMVKRLWIKNMINMAIITGILIIFSTGINLLGEDFIKSQRLNRLTIYLFWFCGFLCCVPFRLMCYQNISIVAKAIVAQRFADKQKDMQERIRKGIVAISTGVVFIYIILLMLILMPIEQWICIYSLLLFTAAIAWGLQGYVTKIYRKAESEIENILTRKEGPSIPGENGVSPILLNDTGTYEIEKSALVVGKKLSEINLHRITGATIISIRRAGAIIVGPGAEDVLQIGDLLVLLGNTEQLKKAQKVLSETL